VEKRFTEVIKGGRRSWFRPGGHDLFSQEEGQKEETTHPSRDGHEMKPVHDNW